MVFLGQASNYHFGRAVAQLFTHGRDKDSLNLKAALAHKYQVEQPKTGEQIDRIALYHTGRSALAAALIATAPKGSKVVIPGLTCIAVVRAVRAAGCEPVFVDIVQDNYQYDLEALAKKLETTPDASTIIVQNTLGITLDIAAVEKLAKKYKINIVEDLAHSAGRFYPDGREVGTVGVAAALSFGKGKAIDTISGGALVLRKAKYPMVNQPLHLPSKGDRRRDRWYPFLGALMRQGYRMGLGKIVTGAFRWSRWIQPSADAELNLDTKLMNWQAKSALKQLYKLSPEPLREPILVRQREKVLEDLYQAGFKLDEIWYDTPVSPERYKKEANFPAKECPNTVKIAKMLVNLPTWYDAERIERAREILAWYEVKHDK